MKITLSIQSDPCSTTTVWNLQDPPGSGAQSVARFTEIAVHLQQLISKAMLSPATPAESKATPTL